MTFGGHVPIDGTNIITVLIRSNFVKFKARAFKYGMEISLHLAIDNLANLDFVPAKFFKKFFHSIFRA